MEYLFKDCYNLKSLDLSKFVGVPISLNYVFQNCYSLKEIKIPSISTDNTKTAVSVFENCTSLESLDLSAFTLSSTTNMQSMFDNEKETTKKQIETKAPHTNPTNRYLGIE